MIEADAGQDKLEVLEAWRESTLFDEQERVALEYGEAMTITGRGVDDELFARLQHCFSEAQIVELTAGIAMENFRSRINVALGVAAQGFCMLPGTPPADEDP